MNKKAQIQMGETVAIVIIVVILLILGLVFWNKISTGDVREITRERQELSVIDIAKIVQEMPEFRCSSTSSEKANCFDRYKILAFKKSFDGGNTQNTEMFSLYSDYFLESRISFREIYPDEETIIIYDSNITNQTTKQIDIPINIYDPITKQYSFGLITIEGFYK